MFLAFQVPCGLKPVVDLMFPVLLASQEESCDLMPYCKVYEEGRTKLAKCFCPFCSEEVDPKEWFDHLTAAHGIQREVGVRKRRYRGAFSPPPTMDVQLLATLTETFFKKKFGSNMGYANCLVCEMLIDSDGDAKHAMSHFDVYMGARDLFTLQCPFCREKQHKFQTQGQLNMHLFFFHLSTQCWKYPG